MCVCVCVCVLKNRAGATHSCRRAVIRVNSAPPSDSVLEASLGMSGRGRRALGSGGGALVGTGGGTLAGGPPAGVGPLTCSGVNGLGGGGRALSLSSVGGCCKGTSRRLEGEFVNTRV